MINDLLGHLCNWTRGPVCTCRAGPNLSASTISDGATHGTGHVECRFWIWGEETTEIMIRAHDNKGHGVVDGIQCLRGYGVVLCFVCPRARPWLSGRSGFAWATSPLRVSRSPPRRDLPAAAGLRGGIRHIRRGGDCVRAWHVTKVGKTASVEDLR